MPADSSNPSQQSPGGAALRLAAEESAKWHFFYKNRARQCPFFVLAPDENLSQWIQQGQLPPGRALDVGCGNGRNSIFLARHGFTVDAIDISASAVCWARDEVSIARVCVAVHCASIFDFALQSGSYDLVYDSGCFHHVAPRQRGEYVQRIVSALKPAGAFGLVCFTPQGGSGYSDAEVYRRGSLGGGLGYDEPRLRRIWGEYFDIQSLRRMRELPEGADLYGKDFLWVVLARKR